MNSRFFKFLINVYPPYLGAGVKVKRVSPDFREVVVQMRLRWYNRNYVRTHFGGSLYAMADPFYMLMLMQILGRDYIVWDQAAHIEFVKPGRGTVTAEFRIDQNQVEEIINQTNGGQKFLPVYTVDVRDESGETVARINKTLYLRRKNPER